MDTGPYLSQHSEGDDMSTTLAGLSDTHNPSESSRTSVSSPPSQPQHPTIAAIELDDPSDSYEVTGWPLLAKLMVARPALEAFSRFREENVKNLLYYQVEIELAKAKLKNQEKEDQESWALNRSASDHNMALYAETLVAPRDDVQEALGHHDQWDRVLKLRTLLKEYNAALLQYAQISELPEPKPHHMESLRQWITRDNHRNHFIRGSGADAWGKLYPDDMIKKPTPFRWSRKIWPLIGTLLCPWYRCISSPSLQLACVRPRPYVDGVTRWIEEEFIPFYHDCQKAKSPGLDEENGTQRVMDIVTNPSMTTPRCTEVVKLHLSKQDGVDEYSERKVVRFTSALTMVIACILPTLAIGVLTTINSLTKKLLGIGGFTALFAVGLIYLTNEISRLSIFTATAAFTAVLVVFVQGQ